MSKFMNTSEISQELNVTNTQIIRVTKELGFTPVMQRKNKPSTVKPGHVWKAKQYRMIKKHFSRLSF